MYVRMYVDECMCSVYGTVQYGYDGGIGGGVSGDGQGAGEHDPLTYIGLLLSGHRVEDVAQLLEKHRREVVVTGLHQ